MLKVAGAGLADIRAGLVSWPIWWMLAWNDVRRRYRRSGLGQFWFTLSMAFTIFGLGFVYSHLFHVDLEKYLPYVTVAFVCWDLISRLVVDSCATFSENEDLLRHVYLPRSLLVLRVMARSFVVAAHNSLLIPVVFLIFGIGVNSNLLWLIVGLFLVTINGFLFGLLLAIICARYRDVPQIVASIMQVVFFVSPVLFQPAQLSQRGIGALQWNPFASLLEVMTAPILGAQPSNVALLSCAALAAIGLVVVPPFAGRYAPRAVYWI